MFSDFHFSQIEIKYENTTNVLSARQHVKSSNCAVGINPRYSLSASKQPDKHFLSFELPDVLERFQPTLSCNSLEPMASITLVLQQIGFRGRRLKRIAAIPSSATSCYQLW